MQKFDWLINGTHLRFSNVGQDLVKDERSWLKNKKLDPWPEPSYSRDLENLGLCNSEPLKQ